MELYLDNFRGFEKQYIELNDVNFLVGENSTGKTTLLGLLSLYSSHAQAWNVEFKNEFVDFGSFSDIVNAGRKSKKTFTVGFKNKSNPNFPQGEILLTYAEQNGFPSLRELSLRGDEVIIKVLRGAKKTVVLFHGIQLFYDYWAEAHEYSQDLVFFKEEINLSNDFFDLAFLLERATYRKKQQKDVLEKLDLYQFYKHYYADERVFWIDPVRSKPKRIYEPQKLKYSAEGEHTPTLLRDILLNNTAKQNKTFITELERFGAASGLFDAIKIDQYRKSKDAPFSLIFKLRNKELKISNIGYGISQILPILTEVLYAPKESTFLIQQPEVHLHPRSQAYFGEFVYNQNIQQKKKFVIETHSDYLIDRFRLQMRKNNGSVYKKTNILFFETDGQTNKVTKIAIDKNGDYVGEQPQKFREFFLKEEMDLLGL